VRKLRIALSSAALVLSASSLASAAPASPASPAPAPKAAGDLRSPRPAQGARRPPPAPSSDEAVGSDGGRWYGWQIMLSDVLGVVTVVGGSRVEPGLAVLGPLVYLAVPPIIHTFHDGPALASLGVRAGLPVAAGFVGYVATTGCAANDESSEPNFCRLGGVIAGALLGMLGAMVVDMALIAYEPSRGSARARSPSPALASGQPSIGLRRGGATLGFGGAF